MPTTLTRGYAAAPDSSKADISRVPALPELDFDATFLSRFDVDAILDNHLSLLHHEEMVDWGASWHAPLSTPLWRFNLHYHEFLLPLAKAWIDTGDYRYLKKAKIIVTSWIDFCPSNAGGPAWDPYTISMRVVNWLSFLGELATDLVEDVPFILKVNRSLAEQCASLSRNLETDLLANHYLEDLKALAILSCYFGDWATLSRTLPRLRTQVAEQILPDGMHFELSPMYHKVVLEDLMRVVSTLRASGFKGDLVSNYRLQDMCDVLWSMESSTNRTPLFNDAGDNVAKSRDALLACAKMHFDIEPHAKSLLTNAGYAILERDAVIGHIKLILDCGRPGPSYAMGHAHCDTLSIECFVDGNPWIVNLGTYAYQDVARLLYKASVAHSAPVVTGHEQHECWAPFRVARYGSCELVHADAISAEAILTTFDGTSIRRSVRLCEDYVSIFDVCDEGMCDLITVLHFAYANPFWEQAEEPPVPYSPEFGHVVPCETVRLVCKHGQEVKIPYYPTREKRNSL